MRVHKIEIAEWRHFRDLTLSVPDAPVICLVGANGTGKSQILELIASCAQRAGISSGAESARADAFSGPGARFKVTFQVAPGAVLTLDRTIDAVRGGEAPNDRRVAAADVAAWDRTLVVGREDGLEILLAGGVADDKSHRLANWIISTLRQSPDVHYLSLDADRSYPRITIQSHELGAATERDWESTLKDSSYRLTRTLYEEWFRYLLGREIRYNNSYAAKIRKANIDRTQRPAFEDQLRSYGESLREVLPHLIFTGVNAQNRSIEFDSTGTPLSFHELSGGEREIAFLVGQIDRFALRRGLLLVDEPELHLNYDLLRQWITFLRTTMELGQIWLATHALEVVEVTGGPSTFLLERSGDNRLVASATPLSDLPLNAALSRAVGSPAFSISSLAFVLTEGEQHLGERERFAAVARMQSVRFLESASSKEVLRRLESLSELAKESGQNIRLGAIIDGDWKTPAERSELNKRRGVFALAVHEIENLFLHPVTLEVLLGQLGQDPTLGRTLVLEAADERAGMWVFDYARTKSEFREYPEPTEKVKTLVSLLKWTDLTDAEDVCGRIASAYTTLSEGQRSKLQKYLVVAVNVYGRLRGGDELWQRCEGKEVWRRVSRGLGFADQSTAELAVTTLWAANPQVVPEELAGLREFLEGLFR